MHIGGKWARSSENMGNGDSYDEWRLWFICLERRWRWHYRSYRYDGFLHRDLWLGPLRAHIGGDYEWHLAEDETE